MPEFIIEYVVTQVRVARIQSSSKEQAVHEVRNYHEHFDSEEIGELVIVLKAEEDNQFMWPRCKTCKHEAEAHDYPNEGQVICDGDNPGDTCNCTEYQLPEGYELDSEGQPVKVKQQ